MEAGQSRLANGVRTGTLMARKVGKAPATLKAQVQDVVLTWAFPSERVTGIEPALSAWEADVLPLNYTRTALHLPRASP
jgi:hypothetical protein